MPERKCHLIDEEASRGGTMIHTVCGIAFTEDEVGDDPNRVTRWAMYTTCRKCAKEHRERLNRG